MPLLRDQLQRHREQRGLSQEELAALVEPPLSPDTISNLERGRTRPHRHTLEALCQALGLDEPARQEVWAAWRAAKTPERYASISSRIAQDRTPTGQPTPLIGREQELQVLQRRLLQPQVRLLTLAGPGGVGKTRLALGLLQRLDQHFRDGVTFVDLSALRDADLVVPTIARTLGIRDAGTQPVLQRLIHMLRIRHLLLVLDNFEHLLDAAAGLAELLGACPDVKVLATSREPLGLRWEHLYVVPSLGVPDPRDLASLNAVREAPAVALFLERAQAADETFALTEANAATIATLCRRLDGLPLALELAAARVRTLSPGLLLDHLGRQLDLLTGARDAPARQQSLRATMEWSYELLSEPERRVFDRLAIFSGGWTLGAAEAVCERVKLDGSDLLNLLGQLVDKSLAVADRTAEGPVRYQMLETIRQYALEHLVESGESDAVNQRLAAYMTDLAERARTPRYGPRRGFWLDRLEQEHDSLRAALAWAVGHDLHLALRLAVATWGLWEGGLYLREGRSWLEQVIDLSTGQKAFASLRARAMCALASITRLQGESELAAVRVVEIHALCRSLGDRWGEAFALNGLGLIAMESEDVPAAARHFEAGASLWRAVGDKYELAFALTNLALAVELQGDLVRARSLLEESVMLRRELGDSGALPTIVALARLARQRQDRGAAVALLRESLALARPLGRNRSTIIVLNGLASLALQDGQCVIAVRLLGAADNVQNSSEFRPPRHDPSDRLRTTAALRARLDEHEFATAWEEGQALTPEEAVADALAVLDPRPCIRRSR